MAVLSNVNALIMACQMDDGVDELYCLILLLFMYCERPVFESPSYLRGFLYFYDSCLFDVSTWFFWVFKVLTSIFIYRTKL